MLYIAGGSIEREWFASLGLGCEAHAKSDLQISNPNSIWVTGSHSIISGLPTAVPESLERAIGQENFVHDDLWDLGIVKKNDLFIFVILNKKMD